MLLRTLGIVAVVAVVLGAAAVWRIGPRNIIGMIRYDRRHKGKLQVGDRAADVTLTALDGSTPVTLAERIGAKPLVIVFGSYT